MSGQVDALEVAEHFVQADAQFRLCVLVIGVLGGLACWVFMWLVWCLLVMLTG